MSDRFVVIVEDRDGLARRVFGIYRSFKAASADAKAWNGTVSPVENKDTSDEPWNPRK